MTNLLLDTDSNIQKQVLNSQDTVTVPGTFTYTDFTYTHDLGYIPSARVWYEAEANKWYPLTLLQLQESTGGDALDIVGDFYLTTTTLVVRLVNLSGGDIDVDIIVRIYADD